MPTSVSLCCFILLLTFGLILSLSPINPESISYRVADSTLLGSVIKIAVMEAITQEDLYTSVPAFCLPPAKPPVDPNDCETFCDYSGKNESCGVLRTVDGIKAAASCTCQRQICQGVEEYEQVVWGQTSRQIALDSSKSARFRFFFPLSTVGFSVKVVTSYGRITTGLSYTDPSINPNNASTAQVLSFHMTELCPGDFRHRPGTWFLGLAVRGERTSLFTVILNDIVPNYSRDRKLVEADQYPCTAYDGYFCPPLNLPVLVEVPATTYVPLLFKFQGCSRVMVHREIQSAVYDIQPVYFSVYGPDNIVPVGVNTYFQFTSHVFTICPFQEQNSITFQVSIGGSQKPFNATLYLSDISAEWGETLTPVSKMNGYSGELYLLGSMKLFCGGRLYDCDPGSSELGTSCNELWVVMPAEDKVPFWPIPRLFYQTDFYRYDSVVPQSMNRTLVGNKLSVGLLLTGIMGNLVFRSLKESELENCSVYFPPFSTVSTAQGEILRGLYPLAGTRKTESCDYQKFRALSELIDQLSASISPDDSLSQSITAVFQIDVLSYTEDWTGCQNFLHELMTPYIQSRTYQQTKLCTLQMTENDTIIQNDPCCNWTLSWDQCCAERDVASMVEKERVSSSKLAANCSSTDCVQSLLEEYIFYEELIDGEHGCSNIIQEDIELLRTRELAYFEGCKQMVFGGPPDGVGHQCYYDSDCLSNNCDRTRGVCLADAGNQRQLALDTFFHCVVHNMSANLHGSVMTYYNLTNETALEVQLANDYMIPGCVGPNGRSLADHHFHLYPLWGTAECGDCEWECFDSGCPKPLECEGNRRFGRSGSQCYAALIPMRGDFNVECLEEWVCNWNQSITAEEECQAPSAAFCGYCFTQYNCHEIGGYSESQCAEHSVCVTPNGTLDLSLNSSTCPIKGGACSAPCPNCTPDQCNQAGRCSDQDVMDKVLQLLPNTTAGFCLGPQSTWNQPDCAFDSDHGSNFPVANLCVWPELTQQQCQAKSLIWHKLARSQAECESGIYGCEQGNAVPTSLRTMKDQYHCALCDGEFTPLFSWKSGTWISGVSKSLQWHNRTTLPQYHSGPVVDTQSLYNFLFERAVQSFVFELITDIHCRLVPTKYLIERAVCSCQGNCVEESNSNNTLIVGSSNVCPGAQSNLVVPPAVLIFSKDSASSTCAAVSVVSILYKNIRASTSTPLDSTFRKSKKTAEGVVNSHGVEVGEFLQNGVGLTISHDLQNVELCFSVDSSKIQSSKYGILDLAQRVSASRVEPMNLNHSLDTDQYCFYSVNLNKDDLNQFFIVSRAKDWESSSGSDLYSTADYVILSVMFVLYLIPLMLYIVYEIIEVGSTWETGRFMNIFMILAMGVRAAFFIALLSSQPTGTQTWWEFIGIELPILFYLSGLSVSAMLWSNITMLHNEKNYTPRGILVGNIILYLLFIALAIANSQIQDNGSYSCFGRVYTEPDTTTNDAIRIAYRCVLTVAALMVAGVLGFWGSAVLFTLFGLKSESATSEEADHAGKWRKRLAKKWVTVIIVCCLSILFQCAFFIAYTVSGKSDSMYALFLIPAEVIPQTFIFCVLHWNFLLSTSSAMSPTGQMTSV